MIERDPLDAGALNFLGYILADRTDRQAEAVALIERALRVEPDNPSYLDSLGWARYGMESDQDVGHRLATIAAIAARTEPKAP